MYSCCDVATMERILSAAAVQRGDPFRPNDVKDHAGLSSRETQAVLDHMVDSERLVRVSGGRYQRPSLAWKHMVRPWTSGRFHSLAFGPLEWSRGQA